MAKYHRFRTSVASSVGFLDAVVMTYIGDWFEDRRTTVVDGKRWMMVMRGAFHEQFDFVSNDSINDSLRRLATRGFIEVSSDGWSPGILSIALTEAGKKLLEGDM